MTTSEHAAAAAADHPVAVRTSLDADTGIGRVVLDNPAQRNALSTAVMRAVTAGLSSFAADPDVRVVVITATGPVFSAGHDLSEMIDRTVEDERVVFDACTEMMETVQRIPQPVIASVPGPAVAAGCQLVAACDLAVASSTAVFGTPGVRIGLFCSTPMVAVTRAVGRKRAMQMLLTGETIDAHTAADWGLINTVVDPDELDAATAALAAKISESSPLTLRIGKEAFYRQIDLPQHEAYELMGETMATNAVTCDAQEGMSAFLAKRTPQWTGR
ncbi:enoyl-CoA hydratase [Tomitella fengzijianii]|uniref:Enoyl-CoA hydratase domain-containing protein 3, mitochondrial n=1 Tax=Tomitella fengzijianii TaxID=2597660 RepID=A0A516X6I9_9ACTN|nr:enoyl-CoA hydratase [Tomitella fengzijianii]QDQ98688.1 enoyl-CoA hydratase [Tomitella fengzijianii]